MSYLVPLIFLTSLTFLTFLTFLIFLTFLTFLTFLVSLRSPVVAFFVVDLEFPVVEFGFHRGVISYILGDKLLKSLSIFCEVIFKPYKDSREYQSITTNFVARCIPEEGFGLFFQLFFELLCRKGFIEKGWATNGRAVDGKVGSWLIELDSQYFVFNLIEVAFLTEKSEELLFPWGFKKSAQAKEATQAFDG